MKTTMIQTLIILAGGKSARFGTIGELIPKSLLPIYETSLLEKQIEEAFAAGIERVIISTHPTFKSKITKLIKHKDRGVIIVSNALHAYSSFAALAYVIREMSISEPIFVSLADIYFLSNPFNNTIAMNENKTCLFLAEPFHKNELMRGGIAFVENGGITKIVAKPMSVNGQGLRWSGLCSITYEHQKLLFDYTNGRTDEFPPEDFFSYLLDKGEEVLWCRTTDFINNNTSKEILLSSLYNLAEHLTDPGSSQIREAANIFRKQILSNH